MAESGSQGARERSRGPRGRSTTRGRSAASGQEVSRSRFERLESQVGHLSDTLLALGPALQQLVQLHAQPSTAAPNVGSPPVVMPAQMPVPPVRTVDPQVPTNAVPPNPNPEFVPSTTAASQMPCPSTPIPVQPADLGNPNTQVDPLQRNDPWRNWYSPSRTAGIPDQPFPTSLPASPDRNGPPPFASAQNLNGVNVPPPPGITGLSGPQSIVGQQPIQIDTPHGSMNDGAEENPFKRSERWMPSVPTPSCEEWKTRAGEITGFLNWLTTLASWTGLGSNAYPSEIMMAIRKSEPLGWHRLQPSQVTRSVRLLSILKLCFSNHA